MTKLLIALTVFACLVVQRVSGFNLVELSWTGPTAPPAATFFQLDVDGLEIIGIARLHNNLFVVCVMNETIFVFQDHSPYTRIRTIKVPQLFAGPFDLVADPLANRLQLIEWRDSAAGGIRVWTVDPWTSSAQRLLFTPKWTGTLSMSADGHRVLGASMWDNIALNLVSVPDAVLTVLDLPPGTADPQHAIQEPAGTFYLTEGWRDGQAHRVTHVSASGNVLLHQYGDTVPGNGTGQLNWPRYLAFTPTGNVLVADYWNRRIIQFNPDLSNPTDLLSHAINDDFGWPQRMITLRDAGSGGGSYRTLVTLAEVPLQDH